MKSKKKKFAISLVIIVRNEKKSSEIIFPKIPKKSVDEIFVIDGKSKDGTPAYFRKKGIKVFTQKIKGLGGATMSAREHCKTQAMIFFHPDGNENPKDIAKVAKFLREGYDFVIPSRMIKGAYNEEDSETLKPRKWFNQALALGVNFLWKKERPFVSEVVQGFRGIRCDAYDKLKIDATDSSIDFQMVVRGLKHNLKFYEFPTQEGNRLFGETNFKSIETGKIIFKCLFREIFNSSTYPTDLV
jgi:glycosyltransferase involved in cell wall biosynthesis